MNKMILMLAAAMAMALPIMAGETCCGARKAAKAVKTNTCATACNGVRKGKCTCTKKPCDAACKAKFAKAAACVKTAACAKDDACAKANAAKKAE